MKTWQRKGRKRLSLDIPEELHKKMTDTAEIYGITLTKLTIRAFVAYIMEQEKFN